MSENHIPVSDEHTDLQQGCVDGVGRGKALAGYPELPH